MGKLQIKLKVTFFASSALFLWITHLNMLPQFGYTAVVLGFTSLAGLALYPGILSRFLSMPLLTTTGRYSYCIYLSHPILIMHANHVLPQRLPAGRWHTSSVCRVGRLRVPDRLRSRGALLPIHRTPDTLPEALCQVSKERV
jgi:peptidoglycan/LPS O-acetylase OafA/YrhL